MSSTNVEAPNSLLSNSTYRILDALCEGEISGFVTTTGTAGSNPLVSTYYDNTPVINPDGSSNYNTSGQGFTFYYTLGETGQTSMPGFGKVEALVPLPTNTEVTQMPPGTGTSKSVTVSFNSELYPDADSIRISIRVPSLLNMDNQGNINGYEIDFAIDISLNNGPFLQYGSHVINGKCTSAYLRDVIYTLPKTTPASSYYDWKVRIRRTTDNILSTKTANSLFVESLSVISTNTFNYPNTVLVATRIDALQFSTVPTRAYHIRGLKVKIPTGYTPTTYNNDGTITPAVYPNVWDGTFNSSKQWTNNPAWVFYDIITNKRYGLGKYIPENLVDKWTLYQIAQDCDTMVDNGAGGLEPKFTCNCAIYSRQDAYQLIQNLISVFQGMTYWYNNQIIASNTNLQTIVQNFTNANVIDGVFTYSNTARNTRSTVINVKWLNPDNYYKETVEIVEDIDGIIKYGYIQQNVTAFACASRGQAIRAANWMLTTQRLMTETITFRTGLEGNYIMPGDLFSVYDNFRKSNYQGGRIINTDSTRVYVNLDREIYLSPGYSYQLLLASPNYNLDTTQLTGSNQIPLIRNPQFETRNVTNSAGYTNQIIVDSGYSTGIFNGSVWLLSATGTTNLLALAEPYRCLATAEIQPGVVEVLGVVYNTGINYTVDTGYNSRPFPVNSGDPSVPLPPSNLQIGYVTGAQYNGISSTFLDLSWTGSASTNVSYYSVSGNIGTGWFSLANQAGTVYRNYIFDTGYYSYDIKAISYSNVASTSLTGGFLIDKYNPFGAPPPLSGIYFISGQDYNFAPTGYLGNSFAVAWKLPTGQYGYDVPEASYITSYKFHILDPNTNTDLITPINLSGVSNTSYVVTPSLISSYNQRNVKLYVENIDEDGAIRSGASLIINNPAPSAADSISFFGVTGSLNYSISEKDIDVGDLSGVYLWYNLSNTFSPNFSNYNVSTKRLSGLVNTNITGSYYAWYSLVDTFGTANCQINGPIGVTGLSATGPAGQPGNYLKRIYLASLTVPSTPVGNNPSGWTTNLPAPYETAIWVSEAFFDYNNNLIGTWSTPQRLSGNILFFNSSAPAGTALVSGDTWFDQSNGNKIMTWDGSGWISAQRILDLTDFGYAVRPIQPLSSLPTGGNISGDVVLLSSDNQLYKYNGTSWSAAIQAVNITGLLTDAQLSGISSSKLIGSVVDSQLAGLSSNKLIGSIVGTQIANGTITTSNILANTILGSNIAANTIAGYNIVGSSISGSNIAGGTITATNIAAGTILGSNIAGQTITAGNIAANTITANQIAANTIQGSNILANTISGGLIAASTISAYNIGANQIITYTANIATGIITDALIANLSAGKITAGTISSQAITISNSNGYLQSAGYSSGVSGWVIRGDGYFEASNGLFRGTLNVGAGYNNTVINSAGLSVGGAFGVAQAGIGVQVSLGGAGGSVTMVASAGAAVNVYNLGSTVYSSLGYSALTFNGDTSLSRSSAGILYTAGSMTINTDLTVNGGIHIGSTQAGSDHPFTNYWKTTLNGSTVYIPYYTSTP